MELVVRQVVAADNLSASQEKELRQKMADVQTIVVSGGEKGMLPVFKIVGENGVENTLTILNQGTDGEIYRLLQSGWAEGLFAPSSEFEEEKKVPFHSIVHDIGVKLFASSPAAIPPSRWRPDPEALDAALQEWRKESR